MNFNMFFDFINASITYMCNLHNIIIKKYLSGMKIVRKKSKKFDEKSYRKSLDHDRLTLNNLRICYMFNE